MADYTPFPLVPWYERPDAATPSRAHKMMAAAPDGFGGVSSEMLSVEQILAQISAGDVNAYADPRASRLAKAIDYTATVTDNRKTIAFTAPSKVLTLPRAEFAQAASEAFELTVSAEAGSVTVARSGADTVLGATSIMLNQGETATFFLDGAGTGWRAAISSPYGTVARTDAANVFSLRQHLAKGTTIASAATIALPSNGNFFDVSGTAVVASISTVTPAGTRIQLRAIGAFTFQHNAASLILPRGTNLAFAVGDIAELISLGGGNYVLASITRADGTALVSSSEVFARVTFNGTGAVSIRSSKNVSSITDNGVGDYTVNFATPAVDANYTVSGSIQSTGGTAQTFMEHPSSDPTINSVRILVHEYGVGNVDCRYVNVNITR